MHLLHACSFGGGRACAHLSGAFNDNTCEDLKKHHNRLFNVQRIGVSLATWLAILATMYQYPYSYTLPVESHS